jgi:hypothetical protein
VNVPFPKNPTILYCTECVPPRILAVDDNGFLSEEKMLETVVDPRTGLPTGITHTKGKIVRIPDEAESYKSSTETTQQFIDRLQVKYATRLI